MTRMWRSPVLCTLGAFALLAGCAASLKVARFDQVPRPPTQATLDVFTSPQGVKRPYKEVALITAEESFMGTSETELTQKMIAKARELGADAVILGNAGQNEYGGVVTGSGTSATYVPINYRTTRCSAIVYTDKQ